MYAFNITIKVDREILEEWLQWQKKIHIPEMMATGCFYEYRFYQLLEHDETDGKTFAIQLLTDSKDNYENYLENYDATLSQKSHQKWESHFQDFRTLLQNVQ